MQNADSVEALLNAMWGAQVATPLPKGTFDWLIYAASMSREHAWLLKQIAALPAARQQEYYPAVLAAQYGQGQKQAARESWGMVAQGQGERSHEDPKSKVQRGLWAARLGLVDEAHALCVDVPEDHPHRPALVAAIARVEGRHPDAERQYHKAIAAAPHILGSYVALAWLYLRCDQPVSAMLHAVAALERLQDEAMTPLASPPSESLEIDALWSLRGYFQRAKQRRYTRETTTEITRRARRATGHFRAAIEELQSTAQAQTLAPGLPHTNTTPPESWSTLAQRHFGVARLRPGQEAVLDKLRAGHNVLAVMPTGAGKSLCYQLPAMHNEGLVLVISPLVALMQDQLASLPASLRQRAVALHSALESDALWTAMEKINEGHISLVFVAPERLRSPPFRHALQSASQSVSLLVVDEAHCVSMWGHDFRPDYLALGQLHRQLGTPQLLALTATAPPQVRVDIRQALLQDAPLVECTVPLSRNNLWLEVLWSEQEAQRDALIMGLCAEQAGSGIVYARTRQRCEDLAAALSAQGIEATSYHAGLPDRAARQDMFMKGDCRVVVATIAFGMGINKPDVRFVIHDAPPRSLEDLIQQVGRAGRDGLPARCTLLTSRAALQHLHRQAHQPWDLDTLRDIYRGIAKQMAKGEIALFSLPSLAASLGLDETRARVAISLFVQAGLLKRHNDTPLRVFIQRTDRFQKPGQLRSAPVSTAFSAFVAQTSLPLHGHTVRTTAALATQLAQPLDTVEPTLLRWQSQGLLLYEPRGRRIALSLVQEVDQHKRAKMEVLLQEREQCQQERGEAMLDYLLRDQCRHQAILGYLAGRGKGWRDSQMENSLPRESQLACQSCDHCVSD